MGIRYTDFRETFKRKKFFVQINDEFSSQDVKTHCLRGLKIVSMQQQCL